MSRRHFLKRAAVAGASLAMGGPLLAAAHRPGPFRSRPGTPVWIRGRVRRMDGQGIPGVALSDGLSVVATGSDGDFELYSSTRQQFVFLTIPSGFLVPQSPTGTARFFAPIARDGKGKMHVSFNLLPDNDATDDHAFLVLADPQTQNAFEMNRFQAETVPDVKATVQSLDLPTAFGLSCGDIMFDHLDLYPDYERGVLAMERPFFQIIGNHDLDLVAMSDPASAATFHRYFGPTYYSFDRGEIHYIMLDDVFWYHGGYLGYLDADQLGWLTQDLARIEAGRTVVVFLHIPAFSTQFRRQGKSAPPIQNSLTNREALYALLEPYEAHLISGHTHESEHIFEGGVHEHVCGAVCGAWWTGDICFDGTPNGYGVFEAHGSELRWRYKSTGRDLEDQLRLYSRGSDPTAPDEIVANVWDWDPSWTVIWYEDGIRKGEMARRTTTDPRSERLHRGPDKPARRPWVDPIRTGHLFFAPVSVNAREVRVEAIDAKGHTYTAAPESA